MEKLDLTGLKAVGLNETSFKRRHRYITVFIDPDRDEKPVIFATPGKGKECLKAFCVFIEAHGGSPDKVEQVVCDMSPAFIAAVGKKLS